MEKVQANAYANVFIPGGNFKSELCLEYFMSNALFLSNCKSVLVIFAKTVIMIYSASTWWGPQVKASEIHEAHVCATHTGSTQSKAHAI